MPPRKTKPIDVENTQTLDETEEVVEVKEENTNKPSVQPTKHEYKPDDLIPCRSLTVGTLLLIGRKTGARYEWADFDDVQYIEYQDLISEMLTNSKYIYRPRFIIEDDNLLSNPKWKRIKSLYQKIYETEELDELLTLPFSRFSAIFPNLPEGYRTAVKDKVATLIHEGNFDSIKKAKLIDEVCGTDLVCTLS